MKIKHYLIASETNDYKPWITSTTAMVFFTVLIWSIRIILPASLSYAASYLDATDIMNRINQERSSRYIATLTTNNKLITAAQSKADDMIARGYFAHVDPDGKYVWPRIEAAGYQPYTTLGENLAMDFTSADELVAAWMNSPTHRANVLNDKFQDQGLALTSGDFAPDHYTTAVVSLFGTLASSTTKPLSAPVTTNTAASSGALSIVSDSKISVTQLSGHNLVDVTVSITGSPTLVTANLKGLSINLLKQTQDTYQGEFTFNASEDLNGQNLNIEARDASGAKVSSSVKLQNISTLPADTTDTNANPAGAKIPISSDAQIMQTLRIIFGVLSIIYLTFLIINAIIVRRNKIVRPGMHHATQIIVFLLVSAINLFVGKF